MLLTDNDKSALCLIATTALRAAVLKENYRPDDPGLPALLEKRGCFVTLKTDGKLRGCLGCFTSDQPLYQTVAAYTAYSALEDPRFAGNRISLEELPKVVMDVSCLTPLEPCASPEKIIPGVHGIYVRSGGRSGCFLPQVATETGWTVEEFWGHCCRDKAGLEWDAWREDTTECMTFTAEVFEC